MNCCSRCGRFHVGSLIFATPGFLFLFQQAFEQWCDMQLTNREIVKMTSLPLRKQLSSSLRSFMEIVNTVPERDVTS